MPIKFAVLRTFDGQAMDLLRPNPRAKAGVGGHVEVLAAVKPGTAKSRVSVNGLEVAGLPALWPSDLTTPTASVTIELIIDNAVVDTKTATVEIIDLPRESIAK